MSNQASAPSSPAAPRVAFVFIGPPHHGKTLARKFFCELTGLRGGSCSDVIYGVMSHFSNRSLTLLQETPKEELRPKLIELGDYLCGQSDSLELNGFQLPDTIYRGPSALLRSLFHTGVLVFDGVRRRRELNHFKEVLQWLGVDVRVVWVERPDHATVDDNTEVTANDADAVIVNSGSAEQLRDRVEALIVAQKEEAEVEAVAAGQS